MPYCPYCTADLIDAAARCPSCGFDPAAPPRRSAPGGNAASGSLFLLWLSLFFLVGVPLLSFAFLAIFPEFIASGVYMGFSMLIGAVLFIPALLVAGFSKG